MQRTATLISALLVFLSLPVFAQPKTRSWTKELEKLNIFVGKWKSNGLVYPSERASAIEIKGETIFTWKMNKTWLLHENIGSGVLQGHGLTTWDKENGVYNFFWFDNLLTRPSEYKGNWLDSQTLLLNGKMHIRGKVILGRIKWQFISEDEINVVREVSDDGKVYRVVLKATFYREK